MAQPVSGKAPTVHQRRLDGAPTRCHSQLLRAWPDSAQQMKKEAPWLQLETLPHPFRRRGGLLEPALDWVLLQPPKHCLHFPSPGEDPGHTTVSSSVRVLLLKQLVVEWAAPTAHGEVPWALARAREGRGRGQGDRCWAILVLRWEEGLSCTKAVAGLLDLAGSVPNDSTTFCCFFKKAFIY